MRLPVIASSFVFLLVLCAWDAQASPGVMAPTSPKKDDDTIRVESTLVQIPVAVRRQDGDPVKDLTASNFKIMFQGVEQKVEFFGNQEMALAVQIVVDLSDSLKGQRAAIAGAAERLIRSMNPTQDIFGVTVVGGDPVLGRYYSEWFVPSEELAERARVSLRKVRGVESRVLIQSINSASAFEYDYEGFDSKIPRKRAVVVMSDFADTEVSKDYEDRDLQERRRERFGSRDCDYYRSRVSEITARYKIRHIAFYPILAEGGDLEKYSRNTACDVSAVIGTAASQTAGRAFRGPVSSLGNIYERMVKDLQGTYYLGFYPDSPYDPAKTSISYQRTDRGPSPEKVRLTIVK